MTGCPGYVKRARERRPEAVIARVASWVSVIAVLGVVVIQVVMR